MSSISLKNPKAGRKNDSVNVMIFTKENKVKEDYANTGTKSVNPVNVIRAQRKNNTTYEEYNI
jgi:hypothetical protein